MTLLKTMKIVSRCPDVSLRGRCERQARYQIQDEVPGLGTVPRNKSDVIFHTPRAENVDKFFLE
jgi:hypothetical protein